MSALKRKSSVALIIGIIMILLLIPTWYMMVAPFMIVSELEKIDLLYVYEGTFKHLGYPSSVLFEAYLYVEKVKGDNVTLKIDVNMIAGLSVLSRNSTYVFNKFTRENVRDAPEADKPREGYDPLFPSHLKADEDILGAWLDNLNTTATLEFKEGVREEGVTLYKYFVEKTITKETDVPDLGILNITFISTKTILIEPLSGLLTYTENETFSQIDSDTGSLLVYLEFASTTEDKAQKLADAKAVHDSIRLLELYIPTILGVIAIGLTIALAYNVRNLKRKKPPEPAPQSPASI